MPFDTFQVNYSFDMIVHYLPALIESGQDLLEYFNEKKDYARACDVIQRVPIEGARFDRVDFFEILKAGYASLQNTQDTCLHVFAANGCTEAIRYFISEFTPEQRYYIR